MFHTSTSRSSRLHVIEQLTVVYFRNILSFSILIIAPDDQTGLLANFLAVCDSLDIFPRPEILDYIISCFHLGIRELDFKTCLHMGSSKFHPQDIYALTKALWHSSYFKRLIVQDMTVTDESLHLISEILKFNSSITHFSLINLKSSKVGISPFVDNISSGIHCLKSLSIAKFHIGDIGIYQICSAFNKLDASLKRLILIEVGMTHKGLQDLVTLLSSSRWSKSLKELDISDNKIGKGQGSETLGSLLKSSHSLVSLNLVRCELDLVPALQALKSNSFLLDIKLETLNLSGNKFYQRCILELAEIIKSSRILKNLYCSKTNLKSDHFEELLTAIKNNPHGIAYFLDVSHNDLGSSCPNKISAVFKTASDKISTIVTTNNDLGTDGFQKFCNCAKMFIGLHTLVLDANVTAGIFSKNLQLGTALATLIKELSSLQILSICGDDKHYLKGALTPFFRYMASNKTLLQLNVSNNRLTDESFEALFEMIEQNDTLQVLNVDNNGWKYKSIKRLRDAILSNNGLIHTSAIPLNDLITIAGNYQKYESSIRMMISEMESRLRNNALMHQKESTSKEDKNAIDRVSKGSGGAGNFIVTSDSTGDYQRATAKSVAVFDEAAKKRHAQIDFEEIDYEIEKELELAENSVASDKSSISGLANSSKEIATGNRSLNSSQRFDLNSLNPEHCMYSYESLKNMNREETPEYLNITFKELYLRDEVFEELFADSKFRYLDWPRWKQVRKKRELGLF